MVSVFWALYAINCRFGLYTFHNALTKFLSCFCLYLLLFAGLTEDEVRKIREAISRASSLEEVERLQRMLQSGQIPGQENGTQNGKLQYMLYTKNF